MRIDLFIIDGQNDFCASGHEPDDYPCPYGGKRSGSLYVTGADREAVAVANMIDRLESDTVAGKHKISKIHATLDSHHRNDGSHNISWKDANGNTPPPFTIVSHQDVLDQKFVPRFAVGVWKGVVTPSLEWAVKYTGELEKNGRSPLTLWPVHCEIGTWGNNIYYPIQKSLDRWCDRTCRWINFISKGHWVWTEHYSGLRADVEDPTRAETQLNMKVLEEIQASDMIVWAGWAGSHCLRWTALDALNYFDSDKGDNEVIKKSVFLEDACAPVPNPPGGPDFAAWRKDFLDEVAKRGATITTTTEFLK